MSCPRRLLLWALSVPLAALTGIALPAKAEPPTEPTPEIAPGERAREPDAPSAPLLLLGAATPTITATVTPTTGVAPQRLRSALLDDDTWRTYHLAFVSLAGGRRDEAMDLLARITRSAPDHPAAARARAVVERLNRGDEADTISGRSPNSIVLRAGRDDPPSLLARAELVSNVTLFGLAIGGELCLGFECSDARAVAGLLLTGGALGLGASLLLTQDGVTPGYANAVGTGLRWGTILSGLAAVATDDASTQAVAGLLIGGQVLGGIAGHLASRATHASAGDVSVVSSMGLYSGALVGFVYGAAADSVDRAGFPLSLMLGSAVGLVAGGFIADALPMSRARALLIDLGAVLGTTAGMGSVLLIQGEDTLRAPFFIAGGLGLVGGVALTAYLTRNLDGPDLPGLSVGFMPREGGGVVTLGMTN